MRKSLFRKFTTSSGTGLGLENMEDITAYYNAGVTDAKAGNTNNRPPETLEYVERLAAYEKGQADYLSTLQPIYWQGYEDAANKTTFRQPKGSDQVAALKMYNQGWADRGKSGGTIQVVKKDSKAGTISGGAPMTGISATPSGDAPPAATAGFSVPVKLGLVAAAVGLALYLFRKRG